VFQVKAAFSGQIEVKTTAERARAFFGDVRNFAELMPGVEKITPEAGGVMRWVIRADVPIIGAMRQAFLVEQTDDSPERIEWSPATQEKKNLLRYAARFEKSGGGGMLVRIEQRVELRRQNARELHFLAGLAGESRLSAEMQKAVTAMMQSFLEGARAKLEK